MAANQTQIVITADDRASAALGKVQQAMGSLQAAAPVLAGALSIGTFAGMIKGSIDAADTMNDLSQKVGISVKELGGWKLAADSSGTSMEAVAKGVKGLSGYMHDHATELKAAGITATDSGGAMMQLADIFKVMPDGVEKTALAVKLFGKAGMDMIPMLNMGSSGLSEMQEKAAEYGRRLAILAPQADRFNDLLAEMSLQSKVLGINIGIELVPSMIRLVEQIMEGKKIAGGWTAAMWEFGVLIDPSKGIPESLNQTRMQLERLHAEMARGNAQNLADGGMADLSDIDRNIGLGERRKKYLEFMQRQSVMENAAKLGDYRDARDLLLANSSTMSVAEAMAKARKLNGGTTPNSGTDAALERMLKRGQENQMGALDSEEEMRSIAAKRDSDEKKREAERLRYFEDLARAREMDLFLATGGEETMREATEKLTMELAKQKTMADDLGITFASSFEEAAIGGKKFSDVVQGLAQDVARIFLRQTVTAPLAAELGTMFKDMKLFQNADGGVYSSPSLHAYANQVVNSPALFKFAAGGAFNMGLMGEAGPEAIMPLKRGTDGRLGVQSSGGVVVNVIEDSSRGGQVARRQGNNGASVIDVFVDRVRAAIASDIATGSGPVPAALANTYGVNRAAGGF